MKIATLRNLSERVAARLPLTVTLSVAAIVCGCADPSGISPAANESAATGNEVGATRAKQANLEKQATPKVSDTAVQKREIADHKRVENGGTAALPNVHEADPPAVVVPAIFGAGPRSERIPQLAQLDRLIGTWTGSIIDQSGNKHAITVSRRWVMGGYYVLSEFQFDDGPKTVNALDVTTFDPELVAYRRWYFDRNGYENSFAHPIQFYGVWEDDGLRLDAIDPGSGNRVNYVQKLTADGAEDWTLNYVNDDGKTVDVYHGTGLRVSRDPLAAFHQPAQNSADPAIGSPNGPTGDIPELRMLNRFVGIWKGEFSDVLENKKADARYASAWAMNGTFLLTQFGLYNYPKHAPPENRIDIQGMQLTTFDPQAKTYRQWHFDTDLHEDVLVRYWVLAGNWSDGPPTMRLDGFAFDSRFQMFWTHQFPDADHENWELSYAGKNMQRDYTRTLANTCTLTREKP